ncbi:ECF-type sigma factor [Enhygromyxa salina]|uniref:ECF-type sigma factor n=1 Tax=Enhygromyxa salina TaxID=215803 RepID=UPI000D0287FB|nr:ECF-type sigma factor [Enhygromyxa salina]
MADAQQPVTGYLRAWRAGDAAAFDKLIEVVHTELHRLARARMGGERAGHTFSPTDLVSEAYLRLVGADVDWHDRAHFFAVAARTMRQILVDHARAKAALKRGGPGRVVTLDEQLIADELGAGVCRAMQTCLRDGGEAVPGRLDSCLVELPRSPLALSRSGRLRPQLPQLIEQRAAHQSDRGPWRGVDQR